ncbi:MAG: DUF2252 domain-containing protein [Frankiaceae bacterium]
MTSPFCTWEDPADVRARGKALREKVSRRAHGEWTPDLSRPDPVAVIEAGNAGRIPDLVPMRIGRMIESAFAFLRGAAAVMAEDLRGSPVSGLDAQICGDAHVANFGFFGSAERQLVMDVNDFDESLRGPWEYDLKRLVASVVVAGRIAGVREAQCRDSAADTVRAYRHTIDTIAGMGVLRAWHVKEDELFALVDVEQLDTTLRRVAEKARRNTSSKVASRWTQRVERSRWKFVEQPPVLRTVEPSTAADVVAGLGGYATTVHEERRWLLGRYAVSDVAFRISGLGSVGLHTYIVLLHGNGEDPLILQVKEARVPVFAAHLPYQPPDHEGHRTIAAQRLMQTTSDILLGWTSIGGRPYYVRQFRDMKGSIEIESLPGNEIDDYARLVGALLARAHSRSLDARLLAGYCGGADALDKALTRFAVAYADQTEKDHSALASAVKNGRLPAETGA